MTFLLQRLEREEPPAFLVKSELILLSPSYRGVVRLLARHFGVSDTTVSAIRRGKVHSIPGLPVPGSRSELEQFLDFVSPEALTGCWLWTGCTLKNGYG